MEKSATLLEKIELLTRLVGELDQGVVVSDKLAHITASQLYYLKSIDKLGSPSFSELTRKLQISKPSVSSGVNRLLQRGLVSKQQSVEDRRVFYISVTAKGKELVEAYKDIYRDYARSLAVILDESEMGVLIELFSKVIKATDWNRR